MALAKLIALWQSEVLLNHEHKENRYQMHVYVDLLDSAFLFDKNYDIKRDAADYLAPPICAINSNLFFQEDPPGSECSHQSNSSDELDLEEEQERQITEAINHEVENLDNGEGVLTANYWESFLGH